jgi:signal transduction histidine kinase
LNQGFTSSNRFGPWALALVLGLAAWRVDAFAFPMLSPDTPLFTFGYTLVLVAFLGLGFGPGLLAALVSFLLVAWPLWQLSPGVALGFGVYVLVGIWAWALNRKIGSLPLTVTLFWLSVGWVFDFTVYPLTVGLPTDYVILLLVKQLMNGIVNASIAELLLGRPLTVLVPAAWRLDVRAIPVATFTFRRVVLLALLPVTILGFFLARSHHDKVAQQLTGEHREAAVVVVAHVTEMLRVRQILLKEAVAAIQSRPEDADPILERLMAGIADARVVAWVDQSGTVLNAFPRTTLSGVPMAGTDISGRRYFNQVRRSLETAYSNLYETRFRLTPSDSDLGFIVAEPVLQDGTFTGMMVASTGPLTLMENPGLLPTVNGATVTLFDGSGAVLASQDPSRPVGMSFDAIALPREGTDDRGLPLESWNEGQEIEFYGPNDGSETSRLGIDLSFGTFRPIEESGWGVLVDRPTQALWASFQPVAYSIIGVFVGVTFMILVFVRRFTLQVTMPLSQAATVARLITEGTSGQLEALEELAGSNLEEVQDLSRSLSRMEESLTEKDLRTFEREELLQAQLLQAQKMEAIGLLAGGVAHDFNNTLTPILGYADLGREIIEDEDAQGFFEQIGEAASRAKEITHQLLAFGRKQTLEIRSMDLSEEVRRSEKLLRQLLRENITLELELPDNPAWVLADAAQVHQILVNLVVNAQDAMATGGHLQIAVERVEAIPEQAVGEASDEPGSHIKLCVCDTGEGIPEAVLPHIFEPFFTTKVVGRGTGLGLSTVYGIVRQHGGMVDVEIRPEGGTRFMVFLPEVNAAGVDDEGSGELVQIAGSGKILVVEDDPAVRALLRSVVSRGGFEVVAVETAEEGLELFREANEKSAAASGCVGFDLLVSDVVLPGMNGRELYDEVEKIQAGLPVIFVSGYSHDVLSKTGLPPRAHLVMKPFRRHELLSKIHDVLGTSVADTE